MRRQFISLDDGRSYPIVIGSNLYSQLPSLLEEVSVHPPQRLMIISDSNVAPLYAESVQKPLRDAGFRTGLVTIPAGEGSKSLSQMEQVIGECLRFGLDRQSVIIALGGGVVGDLAGFVAATYMRGIPFIQLPTTILAHDSSVGGKVAVNHPLGKNYIGAFHQPLMVVFDVNTLHTLPQREVVSGYAEVIKEALIWDADFADWLLQNHTSLLALNPDHVTTALERGCQIKATIVSQDEKETGIRAILNYGHTIGHALEAVAGYGIYTHGEAVAIGMNGAARLSKEVWGGGEQLVSYTEELLRAFQLPVRYQLEGIEEDLLEAMKRDKKAKNGLYTFILSRAVGNVDIVKDVEEEMIRKVLREIRGEEKTS